MDLEDQEDDLEYTYEEDGEEYGEEEDIDENEKISDNWKSADPYGRDTDITSGEDSVISIPSKAIPSSSEKNLNGSGKKRFKHDGDDLGGLKSLIVVPDDGYVIKECTAVEPLMSSLIAEVSSLLDLSPDLTRSLLQASKWDKEKLIDNFFADSEKVLRQSGLNLYHLTPFDKLNALTSASSASSSTNDSTRFKCRICCDPDCDSSSAFSLGCGHLFCWSCYCEYAKNQLSDGPTCVLAHCPEHKCSQALTRTVFHALLQDKADRDKFDLFYIRNFIEVSKNMKYCPAPRCDKVAIGSGVTTVRCSCSYPFCFRCGEEAHEPSSCAQLAEWTEKCMNESETANWILANTRKCPNCNTRIEKNQGCNHMTCRLCKHDFCWICMGNWSEHGQGTGGFYKCNRFDSAAPSALNQHLSAAQRAKAELDRYLHYYQRYHGHDNALKFASNQRELAEKRMLEQQESQRRSSWIDVQFMKQAAEQVIDCRRVLKFTYVLGYFLTDGSPEKQLFEHHQEMLEKNTEKLHEYTEKNIDQVDRTQVVNLTRVTDKFMASLLASMTGGVVTMIDENGVSSSSGSGSSSSSSSGGGREETASAVKGPSPASAVAPQTLASVPSLAPVPPSGPTTRSSKRSPKK